MLQGLALQMQYDMEYLVGCVLRNLKPKLLGPKTSESQQSAQSFDALIHDGQLRMPPNLDGSG